VHDIPRINRAREHSDAEVALKPIDRFVANARQLVRNFGRSMKYRMLQGDIDVRYWARSEILTSHSVQQPNQLERLIDLYQKLLIISPIFLVYRAMI
jgi:hypothetical protein